MDCLPFEVLAGIFSYLGVSDLLAVSSVCKLWREAAACLLSKRVTILITDDATPAIETFLESSIPYQNWVFKEVDISVEGRFAELWEKVSRNLRSLMLLSGDFNERNFINLLKSCQQLEELRLNGLAHLLMPGTLLSNPEDIKSVSCALKNVTRLHLSCSRHLTDSVFSRITSVVGPLRKFSMAGCQISFHSAIYKRFYPADGRVQYSEHVLTFEHILKYVEEKARTLKEISLGQTAVDSESLYKLSKIPGLQLESIHLMSCDQLSKSGIQLLCENQKYITDLDLSLCSRLTDFVVLSICENLPNIKKLNLRRCQGVTENGIKALRQVKCLEELNISHLESVTSESVEEALGTEPRPHLEWLSVASLNLEWKCVASIAAMAPNLVHLDVSMCITGVNDRSVQVICKSLTKLQVLFLNGCTGVSDIGLAGHGLGQNDPAASVGDLGLSLENLGVKERDPYKVQLGSKAECVIRQEAAVKKYLQDNIEQIVKSSEYGLGNLPGLHKLNLCGCKRVTDITLTHALKLNELQYLNLSYCQGVAQTGLEAMAHQCKSLEVLMLAECGQITDHVILVIAHHLKRLKTLDVQHCINLTDDSLDSLSSCHTLRYLDVSGCDKMSLEQVRYVQEKIPLLRNFHYRGVKERQQQNTLSSWFPNAAVKIPPPPPLLLKFKKKDPQ